MEPKQLGPYKIVRRLGRGGMGTVYEGIHSETNESTAIKVLSTSLSHETGFRERFDAEIETLKMLLHPNIVRLLGFGEQDDLPFFVMELVDGVSLDEEIHRGRNFNWREVMQIGIETANALRHAHDRGIIHRDIKPANIMLTTEDQVKLSDFGIARLFGNTKLTAAGIVVGSVEFMAPEQADGRPVDARADLYSLGGVLYALAAGRPPFVAKSITEMLQKQKYDPPEPLRHYAPQVPEELEGLILKLLSKRPHDRVPNAMLLSRHMEVLLSVLIAREEAVAESKAEAEKNRLDSATRIVELPDIEKTSPPFPSSGDVEVDLSPTRPSMKEGEPLTSPGVKGSNPANRIEGTKRTAAFQAFKSEKGATQTPEHSTGQVEDSAEEASKTPIDHFTIVSEEELDREPHGKSDHSPLVSIQTWLLLTSLVILSFITWYFLQPPSVNSLYKRIVSKTSGGTIESLLAAEDDIRYFLTSYSSDQRASILRKYEKDIQLYRLEQKFRNLLRTRGVTGTKHLLPIEHDYLEAIQYVRLDRERGGAKLQALISLYGHEAERSGPVGQCLELAQRRLDELESEIRYQAIKHQGLLKARLEHAEGIKKTNPEQAQLMWKAIIELYGNKPWAREALERSRKAIDKLEQSAETSKVVPSKSKPSE